MRVITQPPIMGVNEKAPFTACLAAKPTSMPLKARTLSFTRNKRGGADKAEPGAAAEEDEEQAEQAQLEQLEQEE